MAECFCYGMGNISRRYLANLYSLDIKVGKDSFKLAAHDICWYRHNRLHPKSILSGEGCFDRGSIAS